ncbi:TPA: diguanylate phosphodiesterase, partial [Klebsiella pneumoniae]|nr:diguanylate phosphodiesterase [Klebsiella pneumoniae]
MITMMQLSKRMIVVSLLVPAILVGLLSLGMAVRQLQRDTAITAEILLGQVDHVTSIARHTLHTTAQMANQPCENVVEKMTETGALTPYIRSTGLVRGDTLVCSSITGSRQQSIRSVYGLPLSAEMGSLEITAING